MTHYDPRPRRSRLISAARTGAALTLLAGGLIALLGWIATSGDGLSDLLGVALLLLATMPTVLGVVGLAGARRRTAGRSLTPR